MFIWSNSLGRIERSSENVGRWNITVGSQDSARTIGTCGKPQLMTVGQE